VNLTDPTTLVFFSLAIVFAIIAVYSMLRNRGNKTGLVTSDSLFVFSALIGSPDGFQSIKFSMTRIETIARQAIQQVEINYVETTPKNGISICQG
jgi:hypothetical protein